TGWNENVLSKFPLNVERSLRLNDRVHGHFTTGHVDTMGKVVSATEQGGSMFLTIEINGQYRRFVWPKGSLAINGVSLTINEVSGNRVTFCLIPETLRRTNLSDLSEGDSVTIEIDSFAR